jgi:hypothetical protein
MMCVDALGNEHPRADFYGDRFYLTLRRGRDQSLFVIGGHAAQGSCEYESQTHAPKGPSHRALAASRIARRMFIRSMDVSFGAG